MYIYNIYNAEFRERMRCFLCEETIYVSWLMGALSYYTIHKKKFEEEKLKMTSIKRLLKLNSSQVILDQYK
jgi:hypothetical protein